MDVYTPEVRKNRKRRRAYSIISLSLLSIYLVLLGAIWLVLRSPFFHLKRISIEGNATVSNGTVMDLLQSRVMKGRFANALLGFKNILIWPESLSGADLVFTPAIKELTIKKDFGARSVEVKVAERAPYGIWCLMARTDADQAQASAENSPRESASDRCWWFDEEGFIFRRAISAEGGLITTVHDYSQMSLGLNQKILPDNFTSNAISVFKVLGLTNLGIKEIRLNDLQLQELEVLTYSSTPLGASDGPKLYFSLRFPADNALQVIESFYAKPGFGKLQYLDFRVENRVYYK